MPINAGSVLDIGSNWGYFSHKFEDTNFQCTAVERNFKCNYFLERFKEIEEESLLSVNFQEIVLATGGSAVFSKKAMQFIKENSIVIYLDATYQDITERVSNFSERGLIKRTDQTVEEAHKERKELYQRFTDHTIKNDKTIDSCVNEILGLIKHN